MKYCLFRYTSHEANEKKIARNVFRKGDRYFRSGDIMTRDDHGITYLKCKLIYYLFQHQVLNFCVLIICSILGYFYFKDRIGDTFRWKCENVSTAEVEGVLLQLTGMKTSIVYGVKIPGTEGRAGMAAIYDTDENLDLEMLGEEILKCLPHFAIPVFIRCIQGDNDNSNMTGEKSRIFLLPSLMIRI